MKSLKILSIAARYKLFLIAFLFINTQTLATTPSHASVQEFWVWDLTVMPPAFRKPKFWHHSRDKLPDRQNWINIWIEENLGEHEPQNASITELMNLLVRNTPEGSLDPSKGILPLGYDYFGPPPIPPGGDRDIHLVIAALPPYKRKDGKTFGFDGFFNIYDQFTEAQAQSETPTPQHSNEKNILYINALQPLQTDYMKAVVTHELSHLLVHGNQGKESKPIDPWLNEMLGEMAMQISGFFTEIPFVLKYASHTEWPLAVNGYGASYGALSLFGEYLLKSFDPKLIKKIPTTRGSAFERIESVYSRSWAALFEGYVKWLFEQNPSSSFADPTAPLPLKIRGRAETLGIAPTGILYLADTETDRQPSIMKTAKTCTSSKNVVRTVKVERSSLQATAVWIESSPPCAANLGGEGFSKEDAFVLK
ncbi:MAG: hypothetical protein AB1540_09130 [Bdellovibrionota bacterium]